MTFRSESERERVVAATALLHDLWGDGLPPGRAPWQRIAADVIAADDSFGVELGVAVQGDDLALAVLAEALTYVPAEASLRTMLPPALVRRMQPTDAPRRSDAPGQAIGARLLSAAIRKTGARWAAAYRYEGGAALLASSLGMTPWERGERSRIVLTGEGLLCRALQRRCTVRGLVPVPEQGGGWSGEPTLVSAPGVAVPFPGAEVGAPAAGALLIVWPVDGDPDPAEISALVSPLAAEAEHLLVGAG